MKLNLKFDKTKLPVNYVNLTQYQRREIRILYIKQQKGICHYCKQPLNKETTNKPKLNRGNFPKGFFKHPIHLHHCHKTGMTIGAVHAYCNAVLWQYHGE